MNKGFAGFLVSTRRNTEKHKKTRKTPIFWHQIGTKLGTRLATGDKKNPAMPGCMTGDGVMGAFYSDGEARNAASSRPKVSLSITRRVKRAVYGDALERDFCQ
jgi:hypothetical protein